MSFPSPADDFLEQSLDLNAYMIQRPSSTFLMKATGSMSDPSIDTGDLLVIDRALGLENNDLAICYINGEFVLKRIFKNKEVVVLRATTNDDIKVKLSSEDCIWGVVKGVIKKLR